MGREMGTAGEHGESLPGAQGLFSAVLVTMASEQHEIKHTFKSGRASLPLSFPWNKRVSFSTCFVLTGVVFREHLILRNCLDNVI